jgi:hypothetical protein
MTDAKERAKGTVGLTNLPPEVVLEHLLPVLADGDIARLSRTSKDMHAICVCQSLFQAGSALNDEDTRGGFVLLRAAAHKVRTRTPFGSNGPAPSFHTNPRVSLHRPLETSQG